MVHMGRGVFCANKARIGAAKAVLLQAKAAAMRKEPHAEISHFFVSAKTFFKIDCQLLTNPNQTKVSAVVKGLIKPYFSVGYG